VDMPRVGSDFAGYQIQGIIGRGGMSVVYQAEHPRLARVVALKVLAFELAEDDRFRERFVRESRLAASLDHPNIIPIFDAGSADDLLYIAMRYVKGDLKSQLQQQGRLRPERVLPIITQVASALDAAHHLGLVHRDVKPANVLIALHAGMEGQDHVYLADFGLTKHATSRSGITGTGQFVGTVDYMAPEQIEGKQVDGRADIYALGCIVYECLTGRVPFTRDNDAAVIWAHLKEDPPRVSGFLPDVPSTVDDVIGRAMGKRADERYPSCMALVAGLKEALDVRLQGDRLAAEAPLGGETVLRGRGDVAAPQPSVGPGAAPIGYSTEPAPQTSSPPFPSDSPEAPAKPSPPASVEASSRAPSEPSIEAARPWQPTPASSEHREPPPRTDSSAPAAGSGGRDKRRGRVVAAVAGVALVVAAAIAAFVLRPGSEGTEQAGAGGGRLTEAALLGDTTRDLSPLGAFPDPVEALFLVAHIGPKNIVRWDCARPDQALEDAVRAVTCSPGGVVSQVSYSLFHDGFRLRDYFTDLASSQGATTAGECAGTNAWRGSWSIGPETWAHAIGGGNGEYRGKVLCFRDSTGQAHVAWLDYATKIFAEATGPPGSEAQAQLYGWWQQEAGPNHPQHIHDLEMAGEHQHEAGVIVGEETVTGTVVRFERSGTEIESVYLEQSNGEETEVYFDPNRTYECGLEHLLEHRDSATPITLPVERKGQRFIATHFTHC
jgi:serine/threonine protein kinase